jgi:hypothetical protein
MKLKSPRLNLVLESRELPGNRPANSFDPAAEDVAREFRGLLAGHPFFDDLLRRQPIDWNPRADNAARPDETIEVNDHQAPFTIIRRIRSGAHFLRIMVASDLGYNFTEKYNGLHGVIIPFLSN